MRCLDVIGTSVLFNQCGFLPTYKVLSWVKPAMFVAFILLVITIMKYRETLIQDNEKKGCYTIFGFIAFSCFKRPPLQVFRTHSFLNLRPVVSFLFLVSTFPKNQDNGVGSRSVVLQITKPRRLCKKHQHLPLPFGWSNIERFLLFVTHKYIDCVHS